MSDVCIYCGRREAITKDHVPPKSFFPKPLPNNLITVPCCEVCNAAYGKDDERVRNIFTSLARTENHPAIREQIADKRNRSWLRPKGKSNFQHIHSSIRMVDVYSPGRIFLGNRPTLDLNQEVVDRFMARITRSLLYHENGIGYVDGKIEWRMAPTEKDINKMSPEKMAFLRCGEPKRIGDDVFTYVGYYQPGKVSSLWIMNFYGGLEFMTILRQRR